jgi:hypothetical protein
MTVWAARSILALALAITAAPGMAQDEDHADHGDGDASAETLTIETAPQQAEVALACRFAVECVEDEACTAAGFSADLRGTAGGLTQQSMVASLTMVTQNGATEFLGVREGTALSLAGGSFEARHLLTVTEAGAARYTLHYIDGPLMVSYLGRCEED